MQKIAVLDSVAGAWRFLGANPALFLRVCGVWFVILLLASIAAGQVGGTAMLLMTMALQLWAGLNIVVSWHRAILIEPAAARFAFTRKEFRLFGYTLFFAMPFVVVAVLVVLMQSAAVLLIGAVAMLALLCVMPRFMLVFPGASVGDEATTLQVSGTLMRGNSLRLLAAMLLAGLPAGVVAVLVHAAAPDNVGAALVTQVVDLVGEVVGIGVVSDAYRLLAGPRQSS